MSGGYYCTPKPICNFLLNTELTLKYLIDLGCLYLTFDIIQLYDHFFENIINRRIIPYFSLDFVFYFFDTEILLKQF